MLKSFDQKYDLASENDGRLDRFNSISHEKVKLAAVMLLLYEEPVNRHIHFALMKRTTHPSDPHSGQMSFPGGRLDEEDRGDLWHCALRENEEEVGLPAEDIQYVMSLPKIGVYVSDFVVQPFVAAYSKGYPIFIPNQDEVDKVITFPVSSLLDDSKQGSMNRLLENGQHIDLPYFQLGYEIIWGATGAMLKHFTKILRATLH